jgi:hypothetical protein
MVIHNVGLHHLDLHARNLVRNGVGRLESLIWGFRRLETTLIVRMGGCLHNRVDQTVLITTQSLSARTLSTYQVLSCQLTTWGVPELAIIL